MLRRLLDNVETPEPVKKRFSSNLRKSKIRKKKIHPAGPVMTSGMNYFVQAVWDASKHQAGFEIAFSDLF